MLRAKSANMTKMLLATAVLLLAGCSHTHQIMLGADEPLTEESAVEASRKPLAMDGTDVTQFEPVPFRDKAHGVFAKNTLGTDGGYVLWRQRGDRKLCSYVVFLERSGKIATCKVDNVK